MSTRTTACEVISPLSAAQQTEWRVGMPDLSTGSDRICCGAAAAASEPATTTLLSARFSIRVPRMTQTSVGVARYGEHEFSASDFDLQDGKYGVPAHLHSDEEDNSLPGLEFGNVKIDWRRHNARLHGGLRNMSGWVESFRGTVNFSDWKHAEIESGEEVGTRFYNRQYTFNGVAQQQKRGVFSGSFGAWGMLRDFKSVGAEALAPPVDQNAAAVFSVQELNFDRFRLQFGGRVERNPYTAQGARSRSFTGFSRAAGINVPLWKSAAVVFNYTSSYRAPALEELYNNGPHLGNLAFEIGNPNLNREHGEGVELRFVNRRPGPVWNSPYSAIRCMISYISPDRRYRERFVGGRLCAGKRTLHGRRGPRGCRAASRSLAELWIRRRRCPVNADPHSAASHPSGQRSHRSRLESRRVQRSP